MFKFFWFRGQYFALLLRAVPPSLRGQYFALNDCGRSPSSKKKTTNEKKAIWGTKFETKAFDRTTRGKCLITSQQFLLDQLFTHSVWCTSQLFHLFHQLQRELSWLWFFVCVCVCLWFLSGSVLLSVSSLFFVPFASWLCSSLAGAQCTNSSLASKRKKTPQCSTRKVT